MKTFNEHVLEGCFTAAPLSLYLFEVRRDCRERGIGREAVELLASGFDYLTLLALPEAVGFWEKTSFVHYERIGTQDPREQQLFVCGHLPQ